MDIVDSLILGIVQGLTEFLPVSSSGHLELGKVILGNNTIPEESLLFTVVLHFATALSTVVVFRKDIYFILKGILKFEWNEDMQFTAKILISMLPAVVIGLLFETQLEQLFNGNILMVGCMLIVTAVLLFLADKATNTGKKVSYSNAFVIGVAQAIAMLPGISRSGATISTSVLLGNDKSKAARFSFLMVLPLIFGKIAKDFLSGELTSGSHDFASLSIGFLGAFIAGLAACTWMIKLVKNSKLTYFAIYCTVVGLIAVILSF
ncbi:MAG TPA: undecaprenyl-diphosphate phosphatase [Flavobacteriaceae bacterium]|nr:undecaprenyl-diphosphate phosphatase [Flavobacteriaceae bacterium]